MLEPLMLYPLNVMLHSNVRLMLIRYNDLWDIFAQYDGVLWRSTVMF